MPTRDQSPPQATVWTWCRRRPALAVFLGSLVLLLTAGTLIMREYDRKHAFFLESGQNLGAFLTDYCRALTDRNDDALEQLYAADASSPTTWEWREVDDQTDAEVALALSESTAPPLDRIALVDRVSTYLSSFASVDKASCKIGLIETVDSNRALLTSRVLVTGTGETSLLEDRLLFDLELSREGTGGLGQGWRIRRQQLVSGIRTAGSGNLFESPRPESLGIDYVHRRDPNLDPSASRPMEFQVMQHAMGGLAVVDYDDDRRPDVFFLDGVESRLFRNETRAGEEITFRDVTDSVGLGGIDRATAALFADFDNDGDRDLFVSRFLARPRLFVSDGQGAFVERVGDIGLDLEVPTTALATLDFDHDGDLDLYLANYGNPFETSPRVPFFARNGVGNLLLENDGNANFRDVTASSGTGDPGWSLATTVIDLDSDGWDDLLVANDFGRKSLYRNRTDGTFEEIAGPAGVLDFSGGMGVAVGDVDGDTEPDIYFSNIQSNQRWYGANITVEHYLHNLLRTKWAVLDAGELWSLFRLVGNKWRSIGTEIGEGNSLFLNQGDRTFVELDHSETNRAGWGWGVIFLDFDNDRDLDLYAANGWISNRPGTDL